MAERNVLEFDKFNLDVEWDDQPKLFKEWADKYAAATRDLAFAENNLKVEMAALAQDIRMRPQSYGIDGKPTVDAVKEAVVLSPRYQAAYKAQVEAQYVADQLRNMKDALYQRKEALQETWKMFAAEYFARPSAPPLAPEQRDKVQKRVAAETFGANRRKELT